MIPLFDNHKQKRSAVVTCLLLLANTAVFVYQLLLAHLGQLDPFILRFGFIPERLLAVPSTDTGLTLLTSMFLHGGMLHLVFNLWFLWVFGRTVEDKLGPGRYLLLYLLSGVGAALSQFAFASTSPIPMVGASGAIAGVLGAYLLLSPGAIIFTLVPLWFAPIIPVPAFVFLMLWFVLQIWQGIGTLAATGTESGVAWWAHFGGFIAGFMLTRKWRRR